MPSLTSLPLSLSEILEARGGPLRELEIWALLCQCAENLQDLLIKGEVVGDDAFRHIITPNSLLVRDNGTVVLSEVTQNLQGSLYMAPESEPTYTQCLSDTAFEKMFVYSLGRTLQVASEFGLKENEVLSISYDLDSLLQAMSERNAAVRLGLIHILEACALQASQHPNKPPHSYVLSRLYKTLLNDGSKLSFHDSNYGSDGSHQNTMSTRPGRARRPHPHVRHRHNNQRPRSGSRSRSRSRSRSLSRNRYIGEDSGHVSASGASSIPAEKGQKDESERMTDIEERKTVTTASNMSLMSSFLNSSIISSASEHSEFGNRYMGNPPYTAAKSVQGLLGLRQGSPAYQKYIQLKERQIRLRQARSGQAPSVLNDVRSRLMTPTVLSQETLDMSETRSMASLMSYTLGTYKPELHTQFGSEAALNYSKDTETDTGSQISLFFASGDNGDALRAEAMPKTESLGAAGGVLPQSNKSTDVHQQQSQDLWQQQLQQQLLHQQQQQVPDHPAAPMTSGTVVNQTTEQVSKHREFYGSEFIYRSKKPAIGVAMPLQGASAKNVALARRVTIVHLTGQRLEVVLDPHTTGRQVWDTVLPFLDLDDFFFFGLTYLCEREHFFLDADTKLHKVAPEGWKDIPKGQTAPATFILYVRIKFYPDSLTDFRHTSSYHLLFLQLRRDILEERVTCDSDTLSRLAGLGLQVDYGDYSNATTEQGYFVLEHYVSHGAVRRLGEDYVHNNAVREHKNCAGIGGSQAEIEFIKHVRYLPEYGIHFYKLSKSKSHNDSFIWVGLMPHSLVLAEQDIQGRSITQDHPWNSILKISFNKRRFSIQPKMEMYRGKPPKINFYTNSYRKGRYLLQFSTDQHRFQIRMRTRPSNMETLAGDMSVEVTPVMADAGVGDDEIGEEVIAPPAYLDPSLQALPDDDDDEDDDLDDHWQGATAKQEQPLQYRSPPPYQAPRMAQILGGLHAFPDQDFPSMHASTGDLTSTSLEEHQLQMLLDMNSRSPSLDSASVSEKPEYEDPPPVYKSPQFSASQKQIGRHIFQATLEKQEEGGIGLTIVGGETTNSLDLGIFVKSVAPGGPAAQDGRIMPGDRLIAIGGTSLEGKQHHEAVAMIRDGGPKIALLVSQIRPPGTIKKRSLQEEQVEFEKKLRNSMQHYGGRKDEDSPLFAEDAISQDSIDFVHFDFIDKQTVFNASDLDSVCHSDEENASLESHSKQDFPYARDSNLYHIDEERHHLGSSKQVPVSHVEQGSNLLNDLVDNKTLKQVQDKVSPTLLNDSKVQSDANSSQYAEQFWHEGVADARDRIHKAGDPHGSSHSEEVENFDTEDEALLRLREDEELSYQLDKERQSWSVEATPQSRPQFFQDGLTEEEREDLQILGDIAALDADDSSSDSDFDTAIKRTVDGPASQSKTGNKAVSAVSPWKIESPAEQYAKGLASDIIYEVILEKTNGSLGVVAHESDQGLPSHGVYVKEILPGSSADKGGILAPGDKILEVGGQNVEDSDSETVQSMLDSVTDLTTVKVSRTAQRDALLVARNNQKELSVDVHQVYSSNRSSPDYPVHEDNHKRELPQLVFEPAAHPQDFGIQDQSLSQLVAPAPKERSRPLDGNLPVVPPPPSLLSIPNEEWESNTQSDVDSDVLDSSRSDMDSIYKNAQFLLAENPGLTPRIAPDEVDGDDLTNVFEKNVKILQEKTSEKVEKEDEDHPVISSSENDGVDSLKLDDSSEFDEQLVALRAALDERLQQEEEIPPLNLQDLDRDQSSPVSLSPSSHSSSTDSVIRSPKKILEERRRSLLRQPNTEVDQDQSSSDHEMAAEDGSYDDDDDVVVTMYGDKPVEHLQVSSEKSDDKLIEHLQKPITKPVEQPQKSVSKPVEPPQRSVSKPVEPFQKSVVKPVEHIQPSIENAADKPAPLPQTRRANEKPDSKPVKISQSVVDNSETPKEQPGEQEPGPQNVRDRAKLLERRMSQKDPEFLEPELLVVSLKRKEGAGFGFTVAGGMNTGGCYVKQLVSEPAMSDGRLRPGDKILKVNGYDTTKLSHVEAVTLLRKLPNVANLQLMRYPTTLEAQQKINLVQQQVPGEEGDRIASEERLEASIPKRSGKSVKDMVGAMDTPKAIIRPYGYKGQITDKGRERLAGGDWETDKDPQLEVEDIELVKPKTFPSSLGISLVERPIDGHTGIFIKRLKIGGVAHSHGGIKSGDRILQANGIRFTGLSQKEAVQILRDAEDKVKLTIQRPVSQAPTPEPDYEVSDDDYEWNDLNVTDDDISSLAEEAAVSLVGEDGDGLDHQTSRDKQAVKGKADDQGRHYISPRKLDVDVPVILSEEWLSDLPLMNLPMDGDEENITNLLKALADLLEAGEPNEEFKNLRQLKESDSCEVGKLPVNKAKNRYRNVLPYDGNRVQLVNSASDYINASHISLETGRFSLQYIACQAPVAESVSDFWLMIWQEKVSVIVALTKLMEKGKNKCHCYWPETKEDVLHLEEVELVVRLSRSYKLENVNVIQVSVEERKTGSQRQVVLLQYIAWPDHGVPETALPLLKILELVHLLESGSPPVIHCSAGLGRTGALIAIDVALATMEQGLEVDLYDIVRNLRTQRHAMIQTNDQYLFCYTACMEALLSMDTQSKEQST